MDTVSSCNIRTLVNERVSIRPRTFNKNEIRRVYLDIIKQGCISAPTEGGSYREQLLIRAHMEKEPLREKDQLRSFLSAPFLLALLFGAVLGALLQRCNIPINMVPISHRFYAFHFIVVAFLLLLLMAYGSIIANTCTITPLHMNI